MIPIKSEIGDSLALEQLGRASVQVVHDLKNQLNGLKLYATFLKKRIEKSGRPADELETVEKLIAGLERAAVDMALLSKFGRPLALKWQKGLNLVKMVERLKEFGILSVSVPPEYPVLSIEADPTALAEALRTITAGLLGLRSRVLSEPSVTLSTDFSVTPPIAKIEWNGVSGNDLADPFNSFSGSEGIRMSYAARIVAEHGGQASKEADRIFVRLPLLSATGDPSFDEDGLSC